MSMEVQQYLNDTGGNFTEMAPRPPVPGEENELQSNGGMSTRSSGSHKSHLSGKSHSSGKSATSHRSDVTHSPAATPRRSNLDKTGGSLSCSETKLDVDDEIAPLGFEPEGSAANSPPFTENTTPAYLKWAENIKHLLDDGDGVKLFKQFLEQEQCLNLLDFWFACKGHKLVAASDKERIVNLAKLIYKKYIKGDQLNLKADTKKGIVDHLKKEQIDQSLFEGAQEEVESMMKNDSYPLFLKSDIYLQYVQNGGESPKTSNNSNNSSGSSSTRPLSGPLPTLHEGEELKPEDLRRPPSGNNPVSLTPATLYNTRKVRENWSARRQEGIYPSAVVGKLPNPYHISYAPVSAQDSELQSLSSDPATDDTMSLTDSSLDGREIPPYGSKAWKKQNKAIRRIAEANRHTNLNQQFIPRTERAPKDRNLAEKEPEKFAELLMEKLERVKEEREKQEHVRQSLKSISVETDEDVEAAKRMPAPISVPCNPKPVAMTTSGGNSLEALLAAAVNRDGDDNAQSILEDHVSRIWDSSNGQTPSRSPGRHSPDRSFRYPVPPGPSPNVSGTSLTLLHQSFVHPAANKGYSHHRRKGEKDPANNQLFLSANSFDSGMGTEERSGIYYEQPETNRYKHVHHYHHHHHHIPKDSKNRSTLEHDAQNWTMQYYKTVGAGLNRSEPRAGWDDNARLHGTGKEARRSGAKKASDSSSNLDSGVSIPACDINPITNPRDPTNEKVMAWMLENEKITNSTTQYSTDGSDKGSSHKRSSHKSSGASATHKSLSSSGKGKSAPVQYNASRSGSLDRSGYVPSSLSHSFTQGIAPGSSIQPSQPFVQDPSMPPLNPPNPTTQLEEAKRRLQDESNKARNLRTSRSFTAPSSKDRRSMPPPVAANVYANTARNIPPTQSQTAPLDLSSSEDQSSYGSHRSEKRTATSNPKKSQPPPAMSQSSGSENTVIGYYFCNEPIPYRTSLPGQLVTLGQFKQLISKKGTFRYFFKTASDEFDSGVVHEEVTEDSTVLPLWEGKVIGKVEKVE